MRIRSLSIITLLARLLLCVLVSEFTLSGRAQAGNPTPQAGGELLQQAEKLTDIRTGDSPSFRLTAKIEVYDDKKQEKDGTYTLLWNSPTIWREEITLPGHSQVRLARINKLLISRNPFTPSDQVYRLEKLIEFSSLLRLGAKDQIRKVLEKTVGGSRERQVEISISGKPWKRVYFDGSSSVPARIEYKGAALGARYPYKDFDLRFELGDYEEFGGLQFPRTLRRFESNVLKVQVQVQEWVAATFGESDFVPPDNSQWIRWCPNIEPPSLQTQFVMSNPDFPPQLRLGGPPSSVVISGIVATDGQWHNLEAVKSAGSMVDSFWMNLMGKQRFKPGHCEETPVEYEMMVEFDYP